MVVICSWPSTRDAVTLLTALIFEIKVFSVVVEGVPTATELPSILKVPASISEEISLRFIEVVRPSVELRTSAVGLYRLVSSLSKPNLWLSATTSRSLRPTALKKSLVSELPPSVRRLFSFCSAKICFLLFFLSMVPRVASILSKPKAKPTDASLACVAAVELLYPLVTVSVLELIAVTSICSSSIETTSCTAKFEALSTATEVAVAVIFPFKAVNSALVSSVGGKRSTPSASVTLTKTALVKSLSVLREKTLLSLKVRLALVVLLSYWTSNSTCSAPNEPPVKVTF